MALVMTRVNRSSSDHNFAWRSMFGCHALTQACTKYLCNSLSQVDCVDTRILAKGGGKRGFSVLEELEQEIQLQQRQGLARLEEDRDAQDEC